MSIRLITLDLDDTLWPVDTVIARAEAIYYSFLREQEPALFDRLSSEDLRAYRLQQLKRHPELQHDISRWRRDSLTRQLCEEGLEEEAARKLSDQAFEIFLEARQQTTLFPDAEEGLAWLARRFKLVALTNGNADVRRMPIGKYFSGALRAEEIKISKPAPEIFHAALKEGEAAPSQTIHIGDDPHYDIEPARLLGIKTLQARITGKHQAAGPGFSHWRDLPEAIRQITD